MLCLCDFQSLYFQRLLSQWLKAPKNIPEDKINLHEIVNLHEIFFMLLLL